MVDTRTLRMEIDHETTGRNVELIVRVPEHITMADMTRLLTMATRAVNEVWEALPE